MDLDRHDQQHAETKLASANDIYAEFLPSIWRQQAIVDDLKMEDETCKQSSDPRQHLLNLQWDDASGQVYLQSIESCRAVKLLPGSVRGFRP